LRVSSPEDGAKSTARTAPTPIPTANVVYLLDHLLWLIASVLCIKFFNRWYFHKSLNAGSTGLTTTKRPAMRRGGKESICRGSSPRGRLYSEPSRLSFRQFLCLPVGNVRHLAHLFPDLAFHFVNLACDFILNAWLYLAGSSCRNSPCS
jgi:hypothetical protein